MDDHRARALSWPPRWVNPYPKPPKLKVLNDGPPFWIDVMPGVYLRPWKFCFDPSWDEVIRLTFHYRLGQYFNPPRRGPLRWGPLTILMEIFPEDNLMESLLRIFFEKANAKIMDLRLQGFTFQKMHFYIDQFDGPILYTHQASNLRGWWTP